MLRIAICDDLLADRIKLRKDIENYFEAKGDNAEKAEICLFQSGDELLETVKKEDFQIVFMDVYMEGISGVETSRQLRKMGRECAIVFTTTSPDHAMEGYAVRASDYLVKPYRQDEVYQALDYVLASIREKGRFLEITRDDKMSRLPMAGILYLEDSKDGCRFHLKSGETVFGQKQMKEILLSEVEGLLQCHRSYAVNAEYVARPCQDKVKMVQGEPVPMDAEYAGQFQKAFSEWVFCKTYGGRE